MFQKIKYILKNPMKNKKKEPKLNKRSKEKRINRKEKQKIHRRSRNRKTQKIILLLSKMSSFSFT